MVGQFAAVVVLTFIRGGTVLAATGPNQGLAEAMSDPHHAPVNEFDGAGKPYKGPSFKGGIAVLVAVIVGVALIWLAYSAALNSGTDRNSVPDTITLEEPP